MHFGGSSPTQAAGAAAAARPPMLHSLSSDVRGEEVTLLRRGGSVHEGDDGSRELVVHTDGV